ncbi:MAG: ral secretion pathway protein, partial [Labilithrix sp.]|nr:ral secretion pathway protein [Labilithrix sp.]
MPFEQALRKNFWLVPLPLVAIAAFLNAQAVSQLIGTSIALDTKQLAQAPPISTRGPVVPTGRVPSAQPILERNPFDHATGSLVAATSSDPDASSPESVDTSDPLSAPTCDGINVSAIASSSDEDWSFASLTDSGNKARLLRRGSEIAGKTVHFVGRDRVWLIGDGSLCQALLFDAKTPAPAPAPPASSAAPPPTRSRGAPLDPDLRKGIQAVSATEFNIDRGVVDKILENQADLMRQARVVPVQENGRVVGVR